MPGEKVLDFGELKWPALQDNDRYKQAKQGKTYYEEYLSVYGEAEADDQEAGKQRKKSSGSNGPEVAAAEEGKDQQPCPTTSCQ